MAKSILTALAWGKKIDGNPNYTEHPPSSNNTPIWHEYDAIYGTHYYGNHWAYCGAGVCVWAFKGGVKLPGSWISVAKIEMDARKGGYWHKGAAGATTGDVAVIDHSGAHTGVIVRQNLADRLRGRVLLDECNTSPDAAGDQFNGGACVRKFRKRSEIYGYARTHGRFRHPKPASPAKIKGDYPRYLKVGMSGADVAYLRHQLHMSVHPHNLFTHQVRDQLAAFQKRHHLVADGVLGSRTAHALRATFKGK